MVMIPNDVARCSGARAGIVGESWREGCEDCARRLAVSTSDVQTWMTPPESNYPRCEYRISQRLDKKGEIV